MQSREVDRERPPRRWLARALALLVATVASLLLLEGGHRLYLRARGEAWDATEALAGLRRDADFTAAFTPEGADAEDPQREERLSRAGLLHPYAGSERMHDTGAVLEHFRERAAPEDYTVVVVGGSVAAALAKYHGEELAAALQADERFAGRRVRVLNYAHAAYKQPQQATRLAYLFSFGYRPDLVVNLDGFNETALAAQNGREGRNPVYPPPALWGVLVEDRSSFDDERLRLLVEHELVRSEMRSLVGRAANLGICRSSVLGTLARRRLNQLGTRASALQQRLLAGAGDGPAARSLTGPDFDASPDSVFALSARAWLEGSRSIAAMCRARGVLYLHALQPTLLVDGARTPTEQERALYLGPRIWAAGVRGGYPLLADGLAELEAEGVRVLDLRHVFRDVERTVYTDAVHVNDLGNELLVRRIAQHLRQLLPR